MNDYKRLILKWQELISWVNVLERKILFNSDYLELHKIISFIWPRRAWKTYFMFSILQKLVQENKIETEQIVFIDFTSFLYDNFDIEKLLEEFFTLFPYKKPFFVFDEIQELENFSKVVMYIFNNNYKIFLSWSNSKLLSSELSTIFRWRSIDVKVFPLNFEEFLYFKNFDNKFVYTEAKIWEMKNLLKEFIDFWAYPEIVLAKNKETKQELIKSYFSLLLYKDLLERYWIENEFVIKFLIKNLLLWITKEFNINKFFNDLKSQNIKIWKQTIYNYLEYLKEIFFVKEINDEHIKGAKKLFFYDVWYNNIIFLENFWQRFENIIFLELVRKFESVCYRKKSSYEIDFVVSEKNIAVQVCYFLSFENFERETKFLQESSFENKFVVYFDKERDFEIKWVKIVSFWEFEEQLKSL